MNAIKINDNQVLDMYVCNTVQTRCEARTEARIMEAIERGHVAVRRTKGHVQEENKEEERSTRTLTRVVGGATVRDKVLSGLVTVRR